MNRDVFEYALIRVVPRLERGELVNAGVIVYCQARSYLAAHCHLDPDRLRALDPDVDIDGVHRALRATQLICTGGPDAGPAGHDDPGRRFRWLTAPRSTIVQPGPIHTGLTTDPAAEATRLLDLLVR
ncbi:Protein of unknown function [Marinactinospora thermotolerans DSM 45154]|uniref:DUF3037 domain-containing protein n=1 Tax=Marinactinospora thermotolerans DSM 45154 TaxID=1122192 RepID=A0A1T4P886_9ACTN|nr:DUF3037 domain-containing protein [Marinactinospora thermotolerans]SJZ87659.1 Protein of unknown function [Marinactinospora thermotolerans DSM 45154]